MLTLYLREYIIPVPRDFSIRLTWRSPMCDFEKIPTGYSLGITIPITDFTRSLFQNPERFTKSREAKSHQFPQFEVRFGGVLLMAGTLSIINISDEAYECNLIDQIGVLSEKQAEKDIRELDVFAKEDTFSPLASKYDPLTNPYCAFPVANATFFEGKGGKITYDVEVPDYEKKKKKEKDGVPEYKSKIIQVEEEIFTNFWRYSHGMQVNDRDNSGNIAMATQYYDLKPITDIFNIGNEFYNKQIMFLPVTVVSPFYYLHWVIEQALKNEGYHMDYNILREDTTLRKLCIYNNFDITRTEALTLQDQIDALTEQQYYNDLMGQIPYLESFYGSTIYAYNRTYTDKIKPKNHLPKMTLGQLLLSTQNLANVCFHILPDNTVNCYKRQTMVDAQAFSLDQFFTGKWEIGEQKSVALKFAREHEQNDLVWTERYTDLSDRREDFLTPVNTVSEMLLIPDPKEGDIVQVRRDNIFYEYKWYTPHYTAPQLLKEVETDILGWQEASIGWQDGWYEYGRDESEDISTDWGCLFGQAQDTQFRAIARQRGNMNAWKSAKVEFSPRLMVQHQGSVGGNETSDFSFDYEKPLTGLFALLWNKWNLLWANRLPVTAKFSMPVNALRFIIYNICAKYSTSEGEFIIEEVNCELYNDHISPVEIKGFKVE